MSTALDLGRRVSDCNIAGFKVCELGTRGLGTSEFLEFTYPRGSIYTTIMELGPQNQNRDGLLGANSIMAVYMDPLGIVSIIVPCFGLTIYNCIEDSNPKP